jgi:acyl-coenzyme A thioesterase PaaI-like protein
MASTTDLLSTWNRLGSRPGGAWIFHRLLARFVPYTGALGARVLELGDGRARVTLADRRRNRNHLGSAHAVALVNLGEMTSGLALITGLDADVRSILVKISAEYLKKARGTLTATAGIEIPKVTGPVDHIVEAIIRNEAEELVCRVEAVWRLDLRPVQRTERPGAAAR